MNAIILAAGSGTRLRPETEQIPKGLVAVGGMPIVERQILCLHEIGIYEIYVVVGYCAQQFNFLSDKYNVRLIKNVNYDQYSNIYSFWLCRKFFSDSWVLEGDVYINSNFLARRLTRSTIYGGPKKFLHGDGQIEFDAQFRVSALRPAQGNSDRQLNSDGYIVPAGISYWRPEAAKIIVAELEEKIANSDDVLTYKSWDYLYFYQLNRIDLYVELIGNCDWVEIDSVTDLFDANNIISKKTPL